MRSRKLLWISLGVIFIVSAAEGFSQVQTAPAPVPYQQPPVIYQAPPAVIYQQPAPIVVYSRPAYGYYGYPVVVAPAYPPSVVLGAAAINATGRIVSSALLGPRYSR